LEHDHGEQIAPHQAPQQYKQTLSQIHQYIGHYFGSQNLGIHGPIQAEEWKLGVMSFHHDPSESLSQQFSSMQGLPSTHLHLEE
jgi:hypothetical protein